MGDMREKRFKEEIGRNQRLYILCTPVTTLSHVNRLVKQTGMAHNADMFI